MVLDRLRYELKLGWTSILLTPIIIMICVIAIAITQHQLHADPARFLMSALEMFFPLAAGLAVSNRIAQEPTLELQLTMPRSYASTSSLRLFLVILWTACLALLFSIALCFVNSLWLPDFMHRWNIVDRWLVIQVNWLLPTLWFMGLGLLLALLINSRTATAAILGCFWVFDILLYGLILPNSWLRPLLLFPSTLVLIPQASIKDFNTYWVTSRLEMLITIVIILLPIWFLLRQTERLLHGSNED